MTRDDEIRVVAAQLGASEVRIPVNPDGGISSACFMVNEREGIAVALEGPVWSAVVEMAKRAAGRGDGRSMPSSLSSNNHPILRNGRWACAICGARWPCADHHDSWHHQICERPQA